MFIQIKNKSIKQYRGSNLIEKALVATAEELLPDDELSVSYFEIVLM